MPNLLSQDEVLVGDIKVLTGGQVQKTIVGSIARADTSAKTLGLLPAGATIIGITLYGATGSDAGTTATVSLGKSGGTGAEYLNGQNVKGNAGVGQIAPSALAVLGSVGSTAVVLTGTYAETGTAATTGGPFTVVVEFVTPTS